MEVYFFPRFSALAKPEVKLQQSFQGGHRSLYKSRIVSISKRELKSSKTVTYTRCKVVRLTPSERTATTSSTRGNG